MDKSIRFFISVSSGVHEVNIRLPESDADGNGGCPALPVSRYMERIADEKGRKFAQARARYDYALTKATYLECAGAAYACVAL